jgi:5-methylcytosine-specific restriction enzyme subunit McrC
METTIPIRNLYYLLCYAWDRLEERDLIDAGSTHPPRDVLNLLGRVLGNGVRALIRRGFERGYHEHQEELAGIRGKIAFAPTLLRQLPRHGRAECIFDELEHDTPANRIIRSTLSYLVASPDVDDEQRHELASLRRHFRDVSAIRATPADCRRVVIHRNNRHYGFLIELCGLVLNLVLPDESDRQGRFRDFARDHRAMARLFEKFVLNFYRHHLTECHAESVSAPHIEWAGMPEDEMSRRLWPRMHSDICIFRQHAPLVIDCKFYGEVLKENQHSSETLSSANLYQLFTYTHNLANIPGWEQVEGLLLYAQVGIPLEIAHTACGRRLRAATVNLDEKWPAIHTRLIQLAQPSAKVM